MRIFENLNIDFLGKRKVAYFISSVLFIIGILSLLFRGLELGIDFKGGSEIALQFEQPVDISQIREYANNSGLGNVEVKTFGGETGVLIRTELQEIPDEIFPRVLSVIDRAIKKHYPEVEMKITDSTISSVTYSFPDPEITNSLFRKLTAEGFQVVKETQEPDNTGLVFRIGIADWIEENLKENLADNPFTILKEEKVGPKIGKELKTDSVIAVALSLVVILIYLGFRFKFVFALGAVAALFHDVMITLGLFSILYGVIPGLNLEISVSVVAAFLTLVGYSINDTVVVFDRVRENLKLFKTRSLADNINTAINRTMRRTIITSLTTLIVVTILLFLGGEVLRGFAFTLFFGIIIGTYSSIFVASPFVYEYATKRKSKIQF